MHRTPHYGKQKLMTHLPRVSVVVPAFNAQRTLGFLLDSLESLDYPDYEVFVVNDGSTDVTADVAHMYPVTLINQPHRGASAARDAGLRASQGEIVAYVDSDVRVETNWLKSLVEPFEDPEVAATTGRTIFQRNDKCTSWVRSLDIERRNAQRKTHTRLANGPNSAFRRDRLLEVGGFDPRWFHAEDTEVSYRLWQNGHQIRYVPSAIVHHVPEENWWVFARKRYRDAKAFTRMLVRYPGSAILKDDFVRLGMKIQPPLFLAIILLMFASLLLMASPLAPLTVLILVVALGVALLLNLPEAIAIFATSRRVGFLFKGLALGILRGFAWGLGLGVGTLRQVVKS